MTATTLNADIAGFADRVNNLLNEKDAISNDVREVYDEAKEQGINTKALRKVIAKRRAKTPDPAVVAAMEAYEHALDEAALMVSRGATLRQAEAVTGFSKSAIQRRQASHRNENAISGTTHDPATGEITETAAGDRLGEESPATEGPGSSLSSGLNLARFAPHLDEREETATQGETPARLCGCEKCVGERTAAMPVSERFAFGSAVPGWRYNCEICGNKRCPHHTDHRLACTNSNEPGQPGSSWENYPPAAHEAGAVGAKPRVASADLVCVVDDGKPCPNTCAREGRCVWSAGTGEGEEPEGSTPGSALPLGYAESQAKPSHSTGDDGLELPRRLDRRVRA